MKFISFFKKQQNFHTKRGCPYPLGTTIYKHGINFAIFSEHATKVTLVLFSLHEEQPWCEIELDPKINKTGNIWHIFIKNLLPNLRYSYRMDGIYNPKKGHFFQEEKLLFDPYAKQLFPHSNWGENMQNTKPWIANSFFSWEDDTPPNIPWDELIMYELHVRGFTKDDSSCVKHPGTYLGLKEKIPYLQELGINAVELLPIHEFYETENINYNPITKERLYNYWGYSTNLFFVPKSAYAVKNACIEFREFVKACHKANIEVILDIVVNHTCEGNEKGPTLHFRGIDNSIYYLMNTEGNFMNFSGCGNTVQCQHIVVQEFILDVLRYWVAEMHVDGFRFDLASILCRDCQGKMLESPPLIERISKDPILKNCKLIAEPWDAGGAYQVGSFPHYNRWAEWNGYYRDKVRAFLKGDSGISADFA
ncbi:MAG TPA: alpha-amylase family glycosyl hydrolase, partial [Planctomycetota bacterium]|nr:alpha-amylase family glycosyl hydrolase [Planctomycetota bacterium]